MTLYRWLREFRGGDPVGEPSGGFVEVLLRPGPGSSSYELELGSGRRLRIPPGFDALDLERLLAVWGRATC